MINSESRYIGGWEIKIADRGVTGLNKPNPNKYNLTGTSNTCEVNGCLGTYRRNRQSGLCDVHQSHNHDLYLELTNPTGLNVSAPAHKDIIDALIDWSTTRNYNLTPFFSSLSFNTLGNIPDVTTLSGDILYPGMTFPTLSDSFDMLVSVTNVFFNIHNNSSYQPLHTPKGDIPAIVLVYTLIGLLICEEANRGDRWFWRIILNDEKKTTQLGAAMPIAYFAAKSFPWGVEMNKSSRNLTM